MFNAVGHRGIYRAGGCAGNRTRRARDLSLTVSALLCAGCVRPPDPGARGGVGDVTVMHAVAWSAADVKAATVGMEIGNQGAVADTLVSVSSPAGAAMLHTQAPGQGMRPIPALPLAPRSSIRIGRGLHLMIENLRESPAVGTTIPVTLRFARAGAMELSIPVLRYSDALTALGE